MKTLFLCITLSFSKFLMAHENTAFVTVCPENSCQKIKTEVSLCDDTTTVTNIKKPTTIFEILVGLKI